MSARLHEAVAAVCPIEGLSIGTTGDSSTVRIDFDLAATPAQRTAAQGVVDMFNWSPATQAAWETTQARTPALSLVDAPDAVSKVLRSLAQTLLDELNSLRQQIVGVATFTFDPANMANATGATSTNVAVAGAAFGDFVDVAAPYTLAGIVATGYVVSAGNIVVRLHNGTGAAVNLPSGTWRVCVRRHSAMPDRTLAQAKTAIKAKITAGAGGID